MRKFQPTIGMEVHVELATESKMFCSCKNGMGQESQPNKNICPVCTGQPGALPVPNEKAIEYVIKAGLALNCHINEESKFDRKNYFYPDLPKGYQISQFDIPFCHNGFLDYEVEVDGEMVKKRVRIHRIHLEEDTGKLMHRPGSKDTLVDYNRSGVPLMELVTEADIESAAEAKAFCEELQTVLRYIKISPADMEKGQMRCEANVSLHLPGEDPLSGTKTELKNLNSFKAVEKAIEYEIERQADLLEAGEKVVQETRGWNESKKETFSQRAKEDAHDYRYFPEPDILPVKFTREEIGLIGRKLPELPGAKRERLMNQYGLLKINAGILSKDQNLAGYFEQVASELEEWMAEEGHKFEKEEAKRDLYRLGANYLIGELRRIMNDAGEDITSVKITPENFAELIKITYEGEINSSATQLILSEMYQRGVDPSIVIEERDLAQNSNEDELFKIVDRVISQNEKSVQDYREGKENAIKYLMGQIMKETQGKANPKMVMVMLREKLDQN